MNRELVKWVNRNPNTFIRPSGHSADYMATFSRGCLYKCDYCYMRRFTPKGVQLAKNWKELFRALTVHSHTSVKVVKHNIPRIEHSYVYYDIGPGEDLNLHMKYYDTSLFLMHLFNSLDGDMRYTFATKNINNEWITNQSVVNHKKKFIRIRLTLMPQRVSSIVEPNTPSIKSRIDYMKRLKEDGYQICANLSPIILYKGWLDDYKELLEELKDTFSSRYMPFEVIFLTHNAKMHEYNMDNNRSLSEQLLWRPTQQINKTSQYGGENVKYANKQVYINQFLELFNSVFQEDDLHPIRYIF